METPHPIPAGDDDEEKSDLRVVMQFFIVPLALVVVLVLVFFGMQILRSRRPDPEATLRSLQRYDGFLGSLVGDLKRWQYGYDFSLLMRGEVGEIDPALVPDLIATFAAAGEGEDRKLRRYVTLALGQSADRRAIPSLGTALRDDDPPTRLFACWGLMRCGDPAVFPLLRGAAGDADAGVRKMAIFALGQLEDEGSRELLRKALLDPQADVGWNAALSLARLGDQAAVPVLLDMLSHPLPAASASPTGVTAGAAASTAAGASAPLAADREVVLNAIRGLALLRPEEARPRLLEMASNPTGDGEIVAAARLALQAWTEEGGR
ncbi:MAG TPA: HEAT repeat domain-containing protein [Candidatus Polarisedimenticolia bacterium]|nr:HEAT repeat domain-containing protein [Candidatus Polarisedimenticolia bacterium]